MVSQYQRTGQYTTTAGARGASRWTSPSFSGAPDERRLLGPCGHTVATIDAMSSRAGDEGGVAVSVLRAVVLVTGHARRPARRRCPGAHADSHAHREGGLARLAEFDADLELAIENAGARTAPNVAVSLDSFYYTESYPHLAANKRPIWVIEQGPGAARNQVV